MKNEITFAKFNHYWNLFWGIAFAVYFGALTALPAYATGADTAIQDGIRGGAQQIWEIIKGIAAPIAVVFLAWAAIKMIFFGERGMDSAKTTFIIIVIVIALVFLAPIVINQIASWFADQSSTAWDQLTN